MNETFEAIAHSFHKRKSKILRKEISRVIDGHSGATILSAIVPLLVELNLEANIEENEVICKPCAMVGLTELLQAIRKVNDEIMEGIEVDE
mgnify:CR=1 FL=1